MQLPAQSGKNKSHFQIVTFIPVKQILEMTVPPAQGPVTNSSN